MGTDSSAGHPSNTHQHQSPPRLLDVDYLQLNGLKPDGFWDNTFFPGAAMGLTPAQQQLSTASPFQTTSS